MRKLGLFLSAVVGGLSLLAQARQAPRYKRMPGTDVQRMRGDWERVGNAMRYVMDGTHQTGGSSQ